MMQSNRVSGRCLFYSLPKRSERASGLLDRNNLDLDPLASDLADLISGPRGFPDCDEGGAGVACTVTAATRACVDDPKSGPRRTRAACSGEYAPLLSNQLTSQYEVSGICSLLLYIG